MNLLVPAFYKPRKAKILKDRSGLFNRTWMVCIGGVLTYFFHSFDEARNWYGWRKRE